MRGQEGMVREDYGEPLNSRQTDFRKGAGISEKGNLTPRDKMKRNSKEF